MFLQWKRDKWQMLLSPFLTRVENIFLNAPWKTTVFDLTRFSIFKSGILPIYSCVCFWLSCFLSTTHNRSFYTVTNITIVNLLKLVWVLKIMKTARFSFVEGAEFNQKVWGLCLVLLCLTSSQAITSSHS